MWSTWALRLGGFLLLALFISVVLNIVFSLAALPDPDYSRDEVAETLVDIEDNQATFALSIAFDIAANLLLVAVAAILYLLLRSGPWYILSRYRAVGAPDPNQLFACPRAIAIMGGFGLTVAAMIFLLADITNIALYRLAVDLNEGGVQGAGEEDILQTARTVGLINQAAVVMGLTALGAGLAVFGGLIALYPLGHTTPAGAYRSVPRWLGWPAIVGGAFMLLGWLAYIDEDLGFVAFIGALLGLVFLITMAAWFLLYAEGDEAAETAAKAT